MPNWIDDNHIEGEMAEVDFLAVVNRRMAERVAQETAQNRPRNYGNDGNVEVYSEIRTDRGVAFSLAVVRYWAVTRNPAGTFTIRPGMGMNEINKWVILESPGVTSPLPYDLRNLLNMDEMLFADTIHSGQESWTLRRMWEHLEDRAREDVGELLGIRERFEERVQGLRDEVDAFLAGVLERG